MKKPFKMFFLPAILILCHFLFSLPVAAEQRTISLTEAVFRTLKDNIGIKIEASKVDQQKGLVQKTTGAFDWITFGAGSIEINSFPVPEREQENQIAQQEERNKQIQQSEGVMTFLGIPFTPTPPVNNPIISEIDETTVAYTIGVSKKMRNGLVITPSLSTIDYKNNTNIPNSEANSQLNLEIVIPLMRGLGKEKTGAFELAAQSGVDTAQLLHRHKISQQIYLTTISFWNCLASWESLKIAEKAEEGAVEIYNLVQSLIKAGEVEPAINHEAQAKLYDRRMDLKNKRLNVYRSKIALTLAMGGREEELADAPLPAGIFPKLVNSEQFTPEKVREYIAAALKNRCDFLAAKTNIKTENILLSKARDDKRPRLDLTFRVGYAGFDDDIGSSRYFDSVYRNEAGPNFYLGFRAELPIFNNLARGEMRYRRSLLDEAELSAEQLSNTIVSDIYMAIENLKSTTREYQFATKAEEEYRKAADHQNYKVREGYSSLSDLINMEEKYSVARVKRIDAIRRYAKALVGLRFATGTLLTGGDGDIRARVSSLMELPFENQTE